MNKMAKQRLVGIVELDKVLVENIAGGNCCICYCSNDANIVPGYNAVSIADCTDAKDVNKFCKKMCKKHHYTYFGWVMQPECGIF